MIIFRNAVRICFNLPLIAVCFLTVHTIHAAPKRTTIPNLHISDFAQDPSGAVWIATAKGLCRFNGYEYEHYYNSIYDSLSIPSDLVTRLHCDATGRLWVSTIKGMGYLDRAGGFNRISDSDFAGFAETDSLLFAANPSGILVIPKAHPEAAVWKEGDTFGSRVIFLDARGRLWNIPADGKRAIRFGTNLEVEEIVTLPDTIFPVTSYLHADGTVWLGGGDGGIRIFDPAGRTLVTLPVQDREMLNTLQVSVIERICENEILIGSKNKGLFLYSPRDGKIVSAAASTRFSTVASPHITTSFIDRDGNIWLGTFDQSYSIEYARRKRFNTDYILNRHLSGKFVTCLEEDRQHNLWIGTRYDGLYLYRKRTGELIHYDTSNFAPIREAGSQFVQRIFCDSHGRLWISIYKSLFRCEFEDGRLLRCKHFDDAESIVTIAEDDFGRVWCGSESNGLTIYAPEQTLRPVPDANVTNILRLSTGEMVFAVFGEGIYKVSEAHFTCHAMVSDTRLAKLTALTISLFEGEAGTIWAGTYGSGVTNFNAATQVFTNYTTENGLPSNDVLAILPDERGRLWMSTSLGLTRFTPSTGTFITYHDYDGTGGDQFHEKCCTDSREGRVYFGGNHGITSFRPDEIVSDTNDIPVILEDIKIFDKSIFEERTSAIEKTPFDLDRICLNHKQDILSIDYAGINFLSPEKINYAYRLIGLNDSWNYAGNYRRASYSNLPPGDYRFEVRAQNSDGRWSSRIRSLDIHVRPSPLLTPWAIMCYILTALVILVCSVRLYIRFKLNREMRIVAENERDREKELARMKMDFFTNISHELRIPLTMIYGPLTILNEEQERSENDLFLLNLVSFNVRRLIKLLDQLLDFGKIENETLLLNTYTEDIVPRITSLLESFTYYARDKNLELKLDCPYPELKIAIDHDKLDKILSNLISNAVKYTPQNGHVRIGVEHCLALPADFEEDEQSTACGYLSVAVTDDGPGIEEEELARMFDRYQRSSLHIKSSITGSGIGLHYVKKLIENHRGQIIARRLTEGGMVFRFILPLAPVRQEPATVVKPEPEAEQSPVPPEYRSDSTVLVVEDDPEISLFLRMLLKSYCRVITASNGKEGLESLLTQQPDAVVSDIMMPEMDGYALCDRIKGDMNLCHIPVILLTAKKNEADQIRGYRCGADAYLGKPFNPNLLKAILHNILTKRDRLRRQLSTPEAQKEVRNEDSAVLNALDRRFLEKLYAYMDRQLADPLLNVNSLGRELGFSRTSFYRKIKALTGEAPNDYLRTYRLNKAAGLLIGQNHTITEVGELTGFASHSHFSACFKKQFGVTPRDYARTGPARTDDTQPLQSD